MSVVTPAGQAEGEDKTETVLTGLFYTPTVGAFKLKGKKRGKTYCKRAAGGAGRTVRRNVSGNAP